MRETQRLELLNQRQNEWVQNAIDAHQQGQHFVTIMAATGTGKSFVFQKWLYRMRDKVANVRPVVWIFSEIDANVAGEAMRKEMKKFHALTGKNLLEDFQVEFYTYQSEPQGERDFDIYDEVDTALTPIRYGNIENSTAKYGLGLTGSIENVSTVFLGRIDPELHGNIRQSEELTNNGVITDLVNKGQLMEILIPCVTVYSLEEGIAEGLLSPFKIYRINHKLDNLDKKYKAWKRSTYNVTEKEVWDTWHEAMRGYFRNSNGHMAKVMGGKLANLLYTSESKIELAKDLVRRARAKGHKIIVFGERIAALEKITPHVAKADNTSELIKRFNKNEIDIIATARKLERRVTLKGITVAIFMSYTSSSSSFLQRLGRVVRYAEGKEAYVTVIVTNVNMEEKWYTKMRTIKGKNGKVINYIEDEKEKKYRIQQEADRSVF